MMYKKIIILALIAIIFIGSVSPAYAFLGLGSKKEYDCAKFKATFIESPDKLITELVKLKTSPDTSETLIPKIDEYINKLNTAKANATKIYCSNATCKSKDTSLCGTVSANNTGKYNLILNISCENTEHACNLGTSGLLVVTMVHETGEIIIKPILNEKKEMLDYGIIGNYKKTIADLEPGRYKITITSDNFTGYSSFVVIRDSDYTANIIIKAKPVAQEETQVPPAAVNNAPSQTVAKYPTYYLSASNWGARNCSEAQLSEGSWGCVCVRASSQNWVVSAQCVSGKLNLYPVATSRQECTRQQSNVSTVCGDRKD